MTEKTPIWRQFPQSFWIANLMENFERMGWYGFYAVSTLYLTNSVASGGLGFTSQDRGVIQGLATFFLYLFPAVFGALADRFGYKRMFLSSVVVMAPAYILLAAPRTFWGFLGVYFLVAVGHGMFKPVVISTVVKTTTEENGSIGFGIFYMVVNIGGFLGPIVAGVVRGWDWKYVFWASAGWILVMGLTCLALYREPPRDAEAESKRSLREVFSGMTRGRRKRPVLPTHRGSAGNAGDGFQVVELLLRGHLVRGVAGFQSASRRGASRDSTGTRPRRGRCNLCRSAKAVIWCSYS